ncbi:cell division protein FtsZ [Candidatus Woesearchaeota archaeon]|nr:cell division protein FtsZ [Nanoarchaeota archaeon]MCB9370222.1 cell division protein FtsZ [Candidatus Woesearchaeota archaeon]USN44747.1 MAG: cell division protein FtsZ [Candidatus Woesearchaeota archaeon]
MDSIIKNAVSQGEARRDFARSQDDEELLAVLRQHQARIKVIGVGGGGNNTLDRISEIGIEGAKTIAINTDAQDLIETRADKKILIGRELTRGLGAGAMPRVGEDSAKESESEIKDAIKESDMIFITCGMGGGTGTGAAPIVAEIAKKSGALVVGVVTVPFAMEGNRRYDNAILGLEKMERFVDTLIVIPNEKLLEIAPNLPLHTAFKLADEVLTNAVKGITELVTKNGLINLDFADIKTVMTGAGMAMIGLGESDSENRAEESVERALNNPLLDVDLSHAQGALINVTGGPTMTLEDARKIVAKISDTLDEDAKVIWGAQILDDLEKVIRTMVVITGVRSDQIRGSSKKKESERRNVDEELGLEFIR